MFKQYLSRKYKMKIFMLTFQFATLCVGYNILLPLPYTYGSISKLFYSLSLKLANSGHQVTFITPFEPISKHENITVITLDEKAKPAELDPWKMRKNTKSSDALLNTVLAASKIFCEDERIQILWKERNKFDMVISEAYFNEIAHIFHYEFAGHTAQICSAGLEYQCLSRLGNKISPSFLPAFMYGLLTENMNFLERIENVYRQYSFQDAVSSAIAQELANKYYPEVGDLIKYHNNMDMMLINSNYVLDYPVPLLPNQVEIGCIDCKKTKPLPKELNAFVEGSGDAGIIFFSLGSVTKLKHMPQDKMEAFLEAFGRLPQRILMKLDAPMKNLPDNVLLSKWFPQEDILNHPKTKVFVSHCGVNSAQEAKYFGVPVLAMPICVDQPKIALKMQKLGQAIILDWETVTAELIIDAIDKLVNESHFIDNMKRVSHAVQDQKETAAERAVWWIEHIIRQGGSRTMRFPGNQLTFMQYFLFDILFAFSCLIFIFILVLRFLCLKCIMYKSKTKKIKTG